MADCGADKFRDRFQRVDFNRGPAPFGVAIIKANFAPPTALGEHRHREDRLYSVLFEKFPGRAFKQPGDSRPGLSLAHRALPVVQTHRPEINVRNVRMRRVAQPWRDSGSAPLVAR